jgi:hypothetical protein
VPCRNGNSNRYCPRNSYSSAEADTSSTPATVAYTKPHALAYDHADGNTNADSISHSYPHNHADGHTGSSSSSVGNVYWR